MRSHATEALGKLGEKVSNPEVVVKALLETLKDADGFVRSRAAEALFKLGEKVSNPEVVIKALLNGSDKGNETLDNLLQKMPAKVIPFLIESLQGSQQDLREAVINYLVGGYHKFEFVNVFVKTNKLIFCINKNDKVTVELPVNKLRELVKVLRGQYKEKFKMIPFLLPQLNFITTPLMQAASEGNLQQVQTLLAEGADARCFDSVGMMAVNQAFNHPAVLKLLIENQQPIDQLFLDTIFSELNFYQGDVSNKKEDEVLLDKLVMLLTGMENIGEKKQVQRKRLLAHSQSFSNNNSQELEGLIGQEFLALHTRHLLQLLAEINRGMHDHQFETSQRLNIINCLKRELLITVQAFHFDLLSHIANSKNSNELRESVAKAIRSALNNLAHGEELIYQTGYAQHPVGHCVYVAFTRIGDQLIVRVDNLWEVDIKNRHQLSGLSNQTQKEKYKPYFIGCFAHRSLQSNKNLLNYLVGIIAAKELPPSQALPKLYPAVDQSSGIALDYLNQWPAKRVQIVGNCVVRSFFVGTHIRLGKDLHPLLRSWESNLLTSTVGAQVVKITDAQQNSLRSMQRGEVAEVKLSAIPNHEEFMKT